MKPKHYERLDADFQVNEKGRLFFDGSKFYDCSKVNVLHSSVDTVRQLYRGFLKPETLDLFERDFVFLGSYEWATGRIGRDSGYQYRLQNADLGLVLLIKNFNVKAEAHGPHLKIEASPHLINDMSPSALQSLMDSLANGLLDQVEHNQCAVHLCIDLQGWEPPVDFGSHLRCRSRLTRQYDGVETIDFASVSAVYNRGQSFLFGSASGLQMAVYNKTLQARAIDKLDYWQSIWKQGDDPFDADGIGNYDAEQAVWRIEFRFHHSVVEQFSQGSMVDGNVASFKTFCDLSAHLDGLLHYGFESFRYMNDKSHVSPIWTILQSDVSIQLGASSLVDRAEYRRYYKTSTGFSGKNIELLLGNAISLAARERLTGPQLVKALKTLPFWTTIRTFYQDKGMSHLEFDDHIEKLLKERYLRWGKAI